MKGALLAHAEFERKLLRTQREAVPLLVLRLPQFERVAWREGKRAARRLESGATQAFLTAARTALRAGDLAAHDPGSDVYAAALLAPSRGSGAPSALDCRAALERLASAICTRRRIDVESGWVTMRAGGRPELARWIDAALERGRRERERYEFFAAVGHELRTPLTSIRGYLETVIGGGLDGATSRRFLATAHSEALRMGRLLEGMFEFSLLDLSAQHLSASSCDLATQIELACEIVHPAAERRGVRVRAEECANVRVALDPDACLQMLVNLLENAVKYGREGGAVHISLRLHDGDAVVRVDDDGPGIPAGEREAIFALRSRGAAAADRPGAGIGLAIVKMIADRAGGTVTVAESPLGGARFAAALPLRAESAPSPS